MYGAEGLLDAFLFAVLYYSLPMPMVVEMGVLLLVASYYSIPLVAPLVVVSLPVGLFYSVRMVLVALGPLSFLLTNPVTLMVVSQIVGRYCFAKSWWLSIAVALSLAGSFYFLRFVVRLLEMLLLDPPFLVAVVAAVALLYEFKRASLN